MLGRRASIFVVALASLVAAAAAAAPFNSGFCANATRAAWTICDVTASLDARAADIVSRLSLADKVNLTVMGPFNVSSVDGLDAYSWWSEATHGVDGVTGFGQNYFRPATNFPLPISTSCAFNRSLWTATGNQIGREARAEQNVGRAGNSFWAPVINIVRDPRWGRNLECAGEDPFASGQYAVNFVTGFQTAKEAPYPLQASACCKHFVANEYEGHRSGMDVSLSAQDLADSYLPPFQACVEEGKVSGLMCAYNSVNGEPCCANSWLLKTLARDSWQFDGYVTSDCDAEWDNAMNARYPNTDDAVAAILRAGTDVNCGAFMETFAPHALANGNITEADLDVILRRQFRVRLRLGHFDPAGALGSIGLDQICTPYSLELARDAARQSAVLAKNDGKTLPLAAGSFASAVVIGPLINLRDTVTYYGSYPCNGSFITPLQAVQEHIPSAVGIAGVNNVTTNNTDGVAAAAAAAAAADLVILTIGSDGSLEEEGHDRSVIDFSPAQAVLIAAVAAAAKGPVVALVFSGGAMDISILLSNPNIAAVVVCGQPSVAVEGTLDAVFGRTLDGRPVAVAGRMSQTTYHASFVNEVDMYDFGMRPGPSAWPPGTNPGRTYRFYTGAVVLPYGFGLSYTTWTYTPTPGPTPPTSAARFAAVAEAARAQELTGVIGHIPEGLQTVAADFFINVTNTGSVDSDDVVLGFLVPPGAGQGGVALQELFGFERVHVPAGQTVTVYLGAQGVRFTQAGADGVRRYLPGNYIARFGVRETLERGMGFAEVTVVADAAAAPAPAPAPVPAAQAVRVGALAPQHTSLRSPRGLHVSWPLVGGALAATPVRQLAAELAVEDDRSGALLLLASRAFASTDEAGTAWLSPAELAQLPASRALSYRVRVRLGDVGAAAALPWWTEWSAPAPWRVGPGPALADWPAGVSWICTSPAGAVDLRSSVLRAEFSLPAGRTATSAVLHAVGLGQFRVSVNGVDLLGAEFNAPGQTDWRKRVLYSTLDVPAALLLGGASNAIAAQLSNGMYNVPSPSNGRYTKWVGSFGPRMLLAALVVTLDDGSNFSVVTTAAQGGGAAWAGTDGGPVSFTHEYAGEDRNASLEIPGFDLAGFDPLANPLVAWAPAQDCSSAFPGGALFPAAYDAVSVTEELPALSIVPSTMSGRVLVDVGRNFAGFGSVTVLNVPAATTVRVWPSETLDAGRIDQNSGGTPMYWDAHTPQAPAGATYNVTVRPTFSMYGWRWLEVEQLPSKAAGALGAEVAVGPSNGTLTVLEASYGVSCSPGLAGDATAAVAAFCNGLAVCPFWVCVCGDNTCPAGAPPCLPDPAQNCAKDFSVVWRCTADAPGAPNRSLYLPAEADNGLANITCGPPPPAPTLPNVAAASGSFVRAAARRVGTWTSSNEWVNRIHNITVEAVEANLQSVLTDCPHRERLGWLEVSHLMFPSIAYSFDISRLWAKISLDTVDSQLPSGMVPDIAPEYTVFSGGFRDSPEWGSAAIQNPGWLLAWYGDKETVNATYATGQRYIDYLLSQRDANGLLSYGLGDWIPVVGSPAGVTGTGQLVQDLQVMSKAAAALGRTADAANYTALAAVAAAAFEEAFYRTGAQTYPTQCAAGYALSLGFATAPAAAQAFIVHDVQTFGGGNVTTSGEVGNAYALRALADAPGGPDAIWASLLRTDAPGYGWMLTMGETALAESWTDAKGDSHIHAMYGHIDEYLFAHVAGIRQAPNSTGWRRVLFAPHPPMSEGAGAFVRAEFESPRGLLVSHARVGEGGALELELTCALGVECAARLPKSGRVVPVPATGRAHLLREA